MSPSGMPRSGSVVAGSSLNVNPPNQAFSPASYAKTSIRDKSAERRAGNIIANTNPP